MVEAALLQYCSFSKEVIFNCQVVNITCSRISVVIRFPCLIKPINSIVEQGHTKFIIIIIHSYLPQFSGSPAH